MIPKEAKPTKDNHIAEGEVTGHYHAVDIKDAIVLGHGEKRFIDAKNTAIVTHQEHKSISLPSGQYQTGICQEYDHLEEEIRKVLD